jgi:hypothetical protein
MKTVSTVAYLYNSDHQKRSVETTTWESLRGASNEHLDGPCFCNERQQRNESSRTEERRDDAGYEPMYTFHDYHRNYYRKSEETRHCRSAYSICPAVGQDENARVLRDFATKPLCIMVNIAGMHHCR